MNLRVVFMAIGLLSLSACAQPAAQEGFETSFEAAVPLDGVITYRGRM